MNCRNCGTPIDAGVQFCPKCGILAYEINPSISTFNNLSNPNIPFMPNNVISETNNINLSSSVNQNADQTLIDTNMTRAGTMPMDNLLDNMGNGVINTSNIQNTRASNNNEGIYYGNLELPENSNKKKIPWFLIAGALVAIMIVGILILPIFNNSNKTVYEGNQYNLQYNSNWKVDEKKDTMTMYYSDNNSRFIFNAVSSFKSLNSSIDSEVAKKNLYDQFYNAWNNIEGGKLIGGTETFVFLTNDTLYARVDYSIVDQDKAGAFYVVISEKYDKVISFMSYCTVTNKEKIDKEVIKMLETITYKREAENKIYDKFIAGETKEYSAIGYMKYYVPECWKLDDDRTKAVQYKSYIFRFLDEFSLLDIKGVTPYNSTTYQLGTSYEAMKDSVAKRYGAIKGEKKDTINGKVWYILITPDYESGGKSFHNEIYFTMSATNKHLYYIEAYLLNDTSEKKTKYIDESIKSIIKSATLYKVTE